VLSKKFVVFIKIAVKQIRKTLEMKFLYKNVDHDRNFAKIIEKNALSSFGGAKRCKPRSFVLFLPSFGIPGM